MSSAMELRAEMVDRQRSGSEADEMRDRKRRQSTAYQHDAMRERGISGAALDEVEEEAPAATDMEGSATPEDSLDAIDGKRTKTFMDPAKKQIRRRRPAAPAAADPQPRRRRSRAARVAVCVRDRRGSFDAI